jgi:hypothetical protein
VETNSANVVDICNTRHRILVTSPENSTKYFVLLIARVHISFTFLSVPFVSFNTLASLSRSKITPQTVVFNDEDFHSVKILETVVRQSEVLAHRKKLLFCKVTHVSIQTFVEGLLRLANVLKATNGTLKNVNDMCTLAINSTKYFVLFSGDVTSMR